MVVRLEARTATIEEARSRQMELAQRNALVPRDPIPVADCIGFNVRLGIPRDLLRDRVFIVRAPRSRELHRALWFGATCIAQRAA